MEKLMDQFSLGMFFWMTILFVALMFLLKKFAWKPILEAINSREEGIREALASAEDAKKEMQNLKSDNENLLKEARAEREAMIKDAREIKEQMIADAKTQAQAEADKAVKQAQETIASEKNAAIAELKNQVATLSVDIAEKVMRNELSDKKKQLAMVEDMLKEVTLN